MAKLERDFVHGTLKPELKRRFPGCMIIKQDPNQIQGIPDLLVLFEDKWASLETKRDRSSTKQANQDYYVEKMNGMSFSSFVNPDNFEEVIVGLQNAFRPSR